MSTRILRSLACAGAVSLILAAAPALAVRPVTIVTGTMTAPASSTRVEVDGKIYQLSGDANTAASLKGLTTGMLVDVILSGPADEPASRVVAVARHTN
jgi:hypothetical protein